MTATRKPIRLHLPDGDILWDGYCARCASDIYDTVMVGGHIHMASDGESVLCDMCWGELEPEECDYQWMNGEATFRDDLVKCSKCGINIDGVNHWCGGDGSSMPWEPPVVNLSSDMTLKPKFDALNSRIAALEKRIADLECLQLETKGGQK